jgi:histidine triad (HIT) family protein
MAGDDVVCVFCRIISGELPSYKIYEDESYLAFLDISQFTTGHTVVIPKKHTQYVWEMSDINDYYIVIQKIANHYRFLGFEYVDSIIFGRKVPHAHVHLIPHSGDSEDYKNAISKLGEMQTDITRHPTPEKATEILNKFKLP